MTWKHNYRFTYAKGAVKVTCTPCGKSSPWFDRLAEDEKWKTWCNRHAGLRLKGEVWVRDESHAPPP